MQCYRTKKFPTYFPQLPSAWRRCPAIPKWPVAVFPPRALGFGDQLRGFRSPLDFSPCLGRGLGLAVRAVRASASITSAVVALMTMVSRSQSRQSLMDLTESNPGAETSRLSPLEEEELVPPERKEEKEEEGERRD